MSFFPPRAAYAETHYKFKLPFSRLFRRAPELLIDAPSLAVPGTGFTLWLVAREAERFPFRFLGISGFWVQGKETEPIAFSCDRQLEAPFHFIAISIPRPSRTGYWMAHLNIEGELNGKRVRYERWNYPGLPAVPLCVHFPESPPPLPEGWLAGETHCHTWHSSDPVEFGAPPAVLQKAAAMQGLGFVLTTDHSYDFAWDNADYMRPADPGKRFASLLEEVAALPSDGPLLIPGEEVSCGNSQGENVHMLVPGAGFYIPGQGDGGRRWFNNRPDLSIADVLQRSQVPCFAAHPRVPMGRLERWVFRRGDWHDPDLHPKSANPLAGLQFWNGSRDKGFFAGRDFWIRQLLQGNPILPIGGNDAHGDLNDSTGVRTPLWSLKHSRHHVFGHVRTVIAPRDSASSQSILEAFRTDRLYLTDGPALWWERSHEGLILRARSTADYGRLESVCLYQGCVGDRAEKKQSLSLSLPQEGYWSFPLPGPGCYLRAECSTTSDAFAMTAAQFSHPECTPQKG